MAAALSKTQRSGLLFAFLGIFAFSLSLPFTKLALKSFDPFFTAFARPVIAACLAIPLMIALKVPKLPAIYGDQLHLLPLAQYSDGPS